MNLRKVGQSNLRVRLSLVNNRYGALNCDVRWVGHLRFRRCERWLLHAGWLALPGKPKYIIKTLRRGKKSTMIVLERSGSRITVSGLFLDLT